ncbi:MAG: hypothetical protein ACK55Z_21435, partial [bacterium]
MQARNRLLPRIFRQFLTRPRAGGERVRQRPDDQVPQPWRRELWSRVRIRRPHPPVRVHHHHRQRRPGPGSDRLPDRGLQYGIVADPPH